MKIKLKSHWSYRRMFGLFVEFFSIDYDYKKEFIWFNPFIRIVILNFEMKIFFKNRASKKEKKWKNLAST